MFLRSSVEKLKMFKLSSLLYKSGLVMPHFAQPRVPIGIRQGITVYVQRFLNDTFTIGAGSVADRKGTGSRTLTMLLQFTEFTNKAGVYCILYILPPPPPGGGGGGEIWPKGVWGK